MIFRDKISNEETNLLEAAQFDGEIVVVDNESGIAAACEDIAQHRIVGFDTETRPSFRAGVINKVALLQLYVPGRCYLIRLCRTRLDKSILKILENNQILKIGVAVHGDIEALRQLRHFRPAGFVELQQIAPEWGIEEKSLRKLSALVLGKKISKAQRLSNWEAAQFTEQQISYAATDAWVCLEILAKLEATPKCNPAPAQEIKAQAEPQKIEQKAKSRRRPFRRRKPHNSKPTTETKE